MYKETCHSNYSSNEAKVLIDNLDSMIINTFRKGLIDEKTQFRVIAEGTFDLDKAISLSIEIEQENSDNKYMQNSKPIGFVKRNGNFSGNQSWNNMFCIFCNICILHQIVENYGNMNKTKLVKIGKIKITHKIIIETTLIIIEIIFKTITIILLILITIARDLHKTIIGSLITIFKILTDHSL